MELNGDEIVSIKEVNTNNESNHLNYLEIRLKSGQIIKCVPVAEFGYDSWIDFENASE